MTIEQPPSPAATPAAARPVASIALPEDEMAYLQRVLPMTHASLKALEASINRLVEFHNSTVATHERSEEGESR